MPGPRPCGRGGFKQPTTSAGKCSFSPRPCGRGGFKLVCNVHIKSVGGVDLSPPVLSTGRNAIVPTRVGGVDLSHTMLCSAGFSTACAISAVTLTSSPMQSLYDFASNSPISFEMYDADNIFRKRFAPETITWYHNRVQLSYGIIGNVHFFW